MNLRVLAAVSGILGGLLWATVWLADPGWSGAGYLTGLVLFGVALAGVGAGLVSRSAVWLRALVAVAFPLLVWSVYAVLKGDGQGVMLDGMIGLLGIAVALGVLVPALLSAAGDRSRRGLGAHAAR